ncbi:MAG: translation elongation factor Ts [Candidatus Magasanikbacteria bacterium]|nr:translation elongation factor Ts [Candidatus Magasanikbacteria bacterium]
MAVNIDDLKKLRAETSASIGDVRQALEDSEGNLDRAREWLTKKGFERAEKKGDRVTEQGLVEAYVHANGKIGVLVELLCETDFVARTDEYKLLAHEIALQVSAMNPKDVEELLDQDYIRDGSKKINGLIKETIAKLGENITLKRFSRIEIGLAE